MKNSRWLNHRPTFYISSIPVGILLSAQIGICGCSDSSRSSLFFSYSINFWFQSREAGGKSQTEGWRWCLSVCVCVRKEGSLLCPATAMAPFLITHTHITFVSPSEEHACVWQNLPISVWGPLASLVWLKVQACHTALPLNRLRKYKYFHWILVVIKNNEEFDKWHQVVELNTVPDQSKLKHDANFEGS